MTTTTATSSQPLPSTTTSLTPPKPPSLRFTLELEFVLSLSNPYYLSHLALTYPHLLNPPHPHPHSHPLDPPPAPARASTIPQPPTLPPSSPPNPPPTSSPPTYPTFPPTGASRNTRDSSAIRERRCGISNCCSRRGFGGRLSGRMWWRGCWGREGRMIGRRRRR